MQTSQGVFTTHLRDLGFLKAGSTGKDWGEKGIEKAFSVF